MRTRKEPSYLSFLSIDLRPHHWPSNILLFYSEVLRSFTNINTATASFGLKLWFEAFFFVHVSREIVGLGQSSIAFSSSRLKFKFLTRAQFLVKHFFLGDRTGKGHGE